MPLACLPPHLKTSRLRLRPLTLEDAQPLLEHLFSNHHALAFLSSQPLDADELPLAQAFIQGCEREWSLPLGGRTWALIRQADHALMGTLSLSPGPLSAAEPSARQGQPVSLALELGYALMPAFWGQRYVAEAVSALCERLFHAYPHACVWGWVHPDNHACQRLIQRLGFQCAPEQRMVRPFPLLLAHQPDYVAEVFYWGLTQLHFRPFQGLEVS